MRRFATAVALLVIATLTGGDSGITPARAALSIDCPDYCGQKAADRCSDINSWECTWYIAGCLAGCNLRKL